MTSVTIELSPEIYARLRAEAQRQGKAEHDLIQEVLAEHLAAESVEPEQPLYRSLAPDVQALVATMTDSDMIVPPRGTPEDAIRLLQSWDQEDAANADEEEEGAGTWEDILRSIDAHRYSHRKLFPECEQAK